LAPDDRGAKLDLARVSAVVVDVCVDAGLIFDEVEVSDEHLIDRVGDPCCEAYG
jgi:hypothetical protein